MVKLEGKIFSKTMFQVLEKRLEYDRVVLSLVLAVNEANIHQYFKN